MGIWTPLFTPVSELVSGATLLQMNKGALKLMELQKPESNYEGSSLAHLLRDKSLSAVRKPRKRRDRLRCSGGRG